MRHLTARLDPTFPGDIRFPWLLGSVSTWGEALPNSHGEKLYGLR